MKHDKKHIVKRIFQVLLSCFVAVALVAVLVYVTQGRPVPVLGTEGFIANKERNLIYFTFILGMFVVIPVFILLFAVAWRYREGNTKAKYSPKLDGNLKLELLWWGIPFIIIVILSIVTWVTSHSLDPYKPLESNKEPVTVQVVAMQWKWLFIYPDKGVATLNYLNIPEDTPINLVITSDAPMNSFWVPALAGQVYAMSGMSTKLHIMADTVGTYNGSSANISGEGFADMRFKVNSMTEADFSDWVIKAAYSDTMLTSESYKRIAKPSTGDGEVTYMLMTQDLYNEIVMKYMSHDSQDTQDTQETHDMTDMPGMTH